MAFAVATCPKCSARFRLVWRIGGKKLPLTTVIRLACPAAATASSKLRSSWWYSAQERSNSPNRSLWTDQR